MDATNCTNFYATDRTFQRTPIGTCETSLIGIILFTLTMFILRLIPVILMTKYWLKNKKNNKKFPVSALIGCMFNIILIVAVVLILLNISNVDNGIAFSMFSLQFLTLVVDYIRDVVKVVHMGDRIIGGRGKNRNNQHLYELDSFGKFNIFIQSISIMASTIILVVLAPVFIEYDELLGSIGFASKAFFTLFCFGGKIYQYERVVRSIKSTNGQGLTKKQIIIKRNLRISQIETFFFGLVLGTLIFALISARIIPWTFYGVYFIAYLDASVALLKVMHARGRQVLRRISQAIDGFRMSKRFPVVFDQNGDVVTTATNSPATPGEGEKKLLPRGGKRNPSAHTSIRGGAMTSVMSSVVDITSKVDIMDDALLGYDGGWEGSAVYKTRMATLSDGDNSGREVASSVDWVVRENGM
jgi:hypothetical protein